MPVCVIFVLHSVYAVLVSLYVALIHSLEGVLLLLMLWTRATVVSK